MSTMRTDGRPSPDAVASAHACGSGSPSPAPRSYQRRELAIGSSSKILAPQLGSRSLTRASLKGASRSAEAVTVAHLFAVREQRDDRPSLRAIAHDLNNLLTAISGYGSLLVDE